MDEENENYLRPGEACRLLKIDRKTLYNWEKKGKIKCDRTRGGQRRVLKTDVLPDYKPTRPEITKRKICYCRVSTSSQKEDLARQVRFFKRKYPDYEIIKDIGSGLNSKRKGFNAILDAGIKGTVEEIVVTHKDRFCRFNFDVFEGIIKRFSNGRIVVLNRKRSSPEEELVEDLLAIVTVFSARLHGLRSHSLKRELQNFSYEDIPDDEGKDET